MNKTEALKFINEKFNSLSLEAKNGTKTVDGYFSGKTTGHFSKHAEGEGVMLYRNSLVVMGKFPLGDGDKVEIKKDTFIRKVTYKSNTLNYNDVIEIYPNGVFCGKYTFAGDYEGIFEDNHGNKYEGKFDLENQLIMQNDKVFTDQIPFNFEQPDKIKLDFANGDKFVGILRGGKFLSGELTYADGKSYVGNFVDGKRNGEGVIFDEVGELHRVEFKDDKVILVLSPSKLDYEGAVYENGIKDGKGKITFKSGAEYVGELKDGKFNGKGEVTIFDSNTNVKRIWRCDDWNNGNLGKVIERFIIDGQAVYYRLENTITKNHIVIQDGMKGFISQGSFVENWKMIGYYYTGEIYISKTSQVYFKGKGKITFADGDTYNGEFKDDLRNGYGVFIGKNGDKYEGYYKDGKQNGKGKEIFADGETYEGEYKEGLRNGYGVYVWKNGNRYEGFWKDDKINGKGKKTFVNGNTYQGDFVDGKFEGYGVYIGKNGYKYSGYFIKNNECSKEEFEQHQKIQQQNAKKTYSDMKSGKDNSLSDKNRTTILKGTGLEGQILQDARTKQILTDLANKVGKATQANKNKVQNKDDKAQKNKGDAETKENNDNNNDKKNKSERLVYKNGSIYEGEIKNGKREGYGVYLGSTGYKYEGYFKDDKQNGKGKEVSSNGSVYEGDFVDGLKSGKGKLTFASGNIYEGEFKDGLRNGYGKMTYKNGNFYEGDFVDEKFEGQGVFTSASGYEYEGEYKANKENGIGKATYANGDRYFGEFVDGKKQGKGKYVFKDGTVLDGEWKNNQICEDDKTKKSPQK